MPLSLTECIGGFKGDQAGHAPQTWPPTSSRIGHLAPLECKKTPPAEHTALPNMPKLVERGVAAPTLGPLGLGLWPFGPCP